MKEWKRVNDYFPNWMNKGGIFSGLETVKSLVKDNSGKDYIFPWCVNQNSGGTDYTVATPYKRFDWYYHGLRSGNKIAGPGLEAMTAIASITEKMFKGNIAAMLLQTYGENWKHLYETYKFEYNPIENYSMRETGTDTNQETTTPNITKETTRTPNLTKETTDQITPGITTTTKRTPEITNTENVTNRVVDSETNVFGFDSTEAVPQNTSKETENGTVTNQETGTETTQETKSGTDTHEFSETQTGTEKISETNGGTETKEGTATHTLERSGNIGVTTSQQMIESERDLWFWNFMEHVYADIDAFITCNIW